MNLAVLQQVGLHVGRGATCIPLTTLSPDRGLNLKIFFWGTEPMILYLELDYVILLVSSVGT